MLAKPTPTPCSQMSFSSAAFALVIALRTCLFPPPLTLHLQEATIPTFTRYSIPNRTLCPSVVTQSTVSNLTLSASAPALSTLPLSLPQATCTQCSHSPTTNRNTLCRYTWGSGFTGQLASGRKDNCGWPKVVKASVYIRSLFSVRVDQVACGGAHTLFRFHDGTVASCGCDTSDPFTSLLHHSTTEICRVSSFCASGWDSSVKAQRCGAPVYPCQLQGLHLARSGKLHAGAITRYSSTNPVNFSRSEAAPTVALA